MRHLTTHLQRVLPHTPRWIQRKAASTTGLHHVVSTLGSAAYTGSNLGESLSRTWHTPPVPSCNPGQRAFSPVLRKYFLLSYRPGLSNAMWSPDFTARDGLLRLEHMRVPLYCPQSARASGRGTTSPLLTDLGVGENIIPPERRRSRQSCKIPALPQRQQRWPHQPALATRVKPFLPSSLQSCSAREQALFPLCMHPLKK